MRWRLVVYNVLEDIRRWEVVRGIDKPRNMWRRVKLIPGRWKRIITLLRIWYRVLIRWRKLCRGLIRRLIWSRGDLRYWGIMLDSCIMWGCPMDRIYWKGIGIILAFSLSSLERYIGCFSCCIMRARAKEMIVTIMVMVITLKRKTNWWEHNVCWHSRQAIRRHFLKSFHPTTWTRHYSSRML